MTDPQQSFHPSNKFTVRQRPDRPQMPHQAPGCWVWASRSSRCQPVATRFISPTQPKPEDTVPSAVLPALPHHKQARARRQVASTATSTAYSLPPSSRLRLQVSRGGKVSAGAVAVCAAARRRGGDGVPRQARAGAHGPRGNSSRPEPLPRIRWLDSLSRFPSGAYMTLDLS